MDNGKKRTSVSKQRKHVGQPLEIEILMLLSLCVLFLLAPEPGTTFCSPLRSLLGLMTGSHQCGTFPRRCS